MTLHTYEAAEGFSLLAVSLANALYQELDRTDFIGLASFLSATAANMFLLVNVATTPSKSGVPSEL